MDIKIVFHPSGDWEALYINGVLESQGHSTSLEDLIDGLNRSVFPAYTEPHFDYNTRDLGNEEGFDEDYKFPFKYEDITA